MKKGYPFFTRLFLSGTLEGAPPPHLRKRDGRLGNLRFSCCAEPLEGASPVHGKQAVEVAVVPPVKFARSVQFSVIALLFFHFRPLPSKFPHPGKGDKKTGDLLRRGPRFRSRVYGLQAEPAGRGTAHNNENEEKHGDVSCIVSHYLDLPFRHKACLNIA